MHSLYLFICQSLLSFAGFSGTKSHDGDNTREHNRRSTDNGSSNLSSFLEESQSRMRNIINSSRNSRSTHSDKVDYRSSDDNDGKFILT